MAGCDQQPAEAPADLPTPIANSGHAEPSARVGDGVPDASEVSAAGEVPEGKGFEFYVLSLSWSPSYCEAEGEDANRQQCKSGRPYAFVVHGLWPQFERGYPQDCATEDRDMSDVTLRSLYDLMPSAGLIRHQWRKHGVCTGLSQADYFHVLRVAREKIVVPAEFRRLAEYRTLRPDDAEQAFIQSNPGLKAADAAVTCDKRYLREVRICLTKQLEFRACPEVDRRACRIDKIVMPPLRGS